MRGLPERGSAVAAGAPGAAERWLVRARALRQRKDDACRTGSSKRKDGMPGREARAAGLLLR